MSPPANERSCPPSIHKEEVANFVPLPRRSIPLRPGVKLAHGYPGGRRGGDQFPWGRLGDADGAWA
jgi:hypothetical protein